MRASGMSERGVLRDDTGNYWAGRMHGGQPGDHRAGVVKVVMTGSADDGPDWQPHIILPPHAKFL